MFWLNNPKVLLESTRIFPDSEMTYHEKLNSIARFALVFLVIIYLLNGNMQWMSFSVTLLVLTIIINRNEEQFTEMNCVKSTPENPYGNFTINDYFNDVNRPSACNISLEEAEENSQKNLNGILPEDIYEKNINSRDFYTLPVTQVLNDQTAFAKSLLGNSGECSHNGNNCLKNQDPRFHRGRYFNGNM